MVTSSSREIHEIGFVGGAHADLPVEVVDYHDVVERMGERHFGTAQRPTFEIVLLVRDGVGEHIVDFESVPLGPARMVVIRPGQVQQWVTTSRVDAPVVLARPEVRRTSAGPTGPAGRDLDDGSMRTAVALTEAIDREQARFAGDEASIRLMTDLYSALLAIFERGDTGHTSEALPEAYVAFRNAIEADLGRSREARTFMEPLAYSERTINRACIRATGLSAKGVLDRRIVLEAKRHLAHTDAPVSGVAAELGFAEAPAFNKFFRRVTGELPSAFRADLRAAGYAAELAGSA